MQAPSYPVQFLQALVRLSYRAPWKILILATLLAGASLLFAHTNLVLLADRSSLISDTDKYLRLSRAFTNEFPAREDIVMVVEGGTSAQREAFVHDAVVSLKREPDLFEDVFGYFELPFLRTHALHFFDVPGLKKLIAELEEARPLLIALGNNGGLAPLMERFAARGRKGQTGLRPLLPFLNEILELLLESLETRGRYKYRSPWENVFFGDVPKDAQAELSSAGRTVIYNTLPGGEFHILTVRSPAKADAEQTLLRLRAIIGQVSRQHLSIFASITGEAVLEIDEMKSATLDANQAAVLSLILITGLYIYIFRDIVRPLMILYILLVSLAWTLGYATLVVGHLNLLTVTFGTILIGLGVDFGVNFLFRYQEKRMEGLPPLPSMLSTMELTGVENLTGAVGMAVAFWAIRFMDFKGVAELGDISGAGVMLCFIGMVTMLPALVFLQERTFNPTPRPPVRAGNKAARAETWLLKRPWWVLGLATLLTLLSLSRLPEVRFDYNLLHMQSQKLESVRTELRLIGSSRRSVIFGVSTANSLDEALRLTRQFQARPTVAAVESFLALLPEDYELKAPLLQRLEILMRDVVVPRVPSQLPDSQSLRGLSVGFVELESTFHAALPVLLKDPDIKVRREALKFNRLLNQLFHTLETMGPGPMTDGLDAFQRDFFVDLRGMVEFLKAQRSGPPIQLRDLPPELKIRGIGVTGKILLRIYPKFNVWEREPQERFALDLQKVDGNVIGTPIMMFHHTEAMRAAYETSGWYALGVIVVLLLIHFKSLSETLLALLPKVMGVLWMLGLMVYFDVSFNPANFMALPLVMGIGLVFGIHVLQRAREEGSNAMFGRSTGLAIVLDALTNVAGFGALMGAQHQGIASLGFVLTVGTLTNLATALFVLPALLQVLPTPGYPRKVEPTYPSEPPLLS